MFRFAHFIRWLCGGMWDHVLVQLWLSKPLLYGSSPRHAGKGAVGAVEVGGVARREIAETRFVVGYRNERDPRIGV